MNTLPNNLVLAAVITLAATSPSIAQTRDAVTPNEPAWVLGSTINNRANANQRAPGAGITRDLRPDTKQTATGGPVGGSYGGSG